VRRTESDIRSDRCQWHPDSKHRKLDARFSKPDTRRGAMAVIRRTPTSTSSSLQQSQVRLLRRARRHVLGLDRNERIDGEGNAWIRGLRCGRNKFNAIVGVVPDLREGVDVSPFLGTCQAANILDSATPSMSTGPPTISSSPQRGHLPPPASMYLRTISGVIGLVPPPAIKDRNWPGFTAVL
jgi:hypothetical protein